MIWLQVFKGDTEYNLLVGKKMSPKGVALLHGMALLE